MRHLVLLAVLALPAGCSPTTDITRTSTEPTAGRAPYDVVEFQSTGDALRIKLKVASMRAARQVAEDVVIKTRTRSDRVQVNVYRLTDRTEGSPAAVLKWSTAEGFNFYEK